jgi:hypothetical protein
MWLATTTLCVFVKEIKIEHTNEYFPEPSRKKQRALRHLLRSALLPARRSSQPFYAHAFELYSRTGTNYF